GERVPLALGAARPPAATPFLGREVAQELARVRPYPGSPPGAALRLLGTERLDGSAAELAERRPGTARASRLDEEEVVTPLEVPARQRDERGAARAREADAPDEARERV